MRLSEAAQGDAEPWQRPLYRIGRSVAIFAAREGADVTITYLAAEEHECASGLRFFR